MKTNCISSENFTVIAIKKKKGKVQLVPQLAPLSLPPPPTNHALKFQRFRQLFETVLRVLRPSPVSPSTGVGVDVAVDADATACAHADISAAVGVAVVRRIFFLVRFWESSFGGSPQCTHTGAQLLACPYTPPVSMCGCPSLCACPYDQGVYTK